MKTGFLLGVLCCLVLLAIFGPRLVEKRPSADRNRNGEVKSIVDRVPGLASSDRRSRKNRQLPPPTVYVNPYVASASSEGQTVPTAGPVNERAVWPWAFVGFIAGTIVTSLLGWCLLHKKRIRSRSNGRGTCSAPNPTATETSRDPARYRVG